MVECDDVLLPLVCDISGNFTWAGRVGVLVMESDEIVQYWHIIIIIMIHET